MSDHVDGPRSIGEPAADLTDLFAFISPENPARTVLAACVFPSAGEDRDVLERDRLLDRGSPRDRCRRWPRREVSARRRGDPLQFPVRGPEARCCGQPDPARRLHPAGRPQAVAHGERREGRIDAGGRCPRVRRAALRSFLPRLDRRRAQEGSNLLQHDNVLSMVVEFDTRRVLDPAKGSLFGAIAETVPIPQPPTPHRTSGRPHRLGRTPRADQHAA